MARPRAGKQAGQHGVKRKWAALEAAAVQPVIQVPAQLAIEPVSDEDAASESGASEQSEEYLLDSFEQELAAPVEAFNEAVASTTAFLQPSEQLSTLARSAAKVSMQSGFQSILQDTQNCRSLKMRHHKLS